MSNAKRPTRQTPLPGRGSAARARWAVVVVACLCVVAVIAIPVLLNRGDDTPAPLTADNPSPTSVDDVTCDEPPATPLAPQQFATPPDAELSAGATWTAVVHTSCGDIEVELDGAKAPQTVASFISLARSDYWNDSPCHRLTASGAGISVLQCGDPTGTGSGSPGYGFGVENAPADGDYPRGTLAMARGDDPNSNGGQFFFVYQDTKLPTEGGGYSIFGKVTGGMQVVDAIAQQGVADDQQDGPPAQSISILSVEVSQA